MIALFSGRFDLPHCGHIAQLVRLGRKFDRVLVPVLDYPEQKWPVQYRVQVLRDCFFGDPRFHIFANKEHFAKITLDECSKYTFDVYVSQNMECLRRMEQLGFNVLYVDRAYDFSSSKELC